MTLFFPPGCGSYLAKIFIRTFILPLSSQRFSSQYEEKDPSLAVWPKSDSCERHTRMAFANARYPEDEVCAEEDKGEMPTFVLKTAGKLAKTAK